MASINIASRQSSSAGLIIRQKEPTNLEMPFDQVDSYLTPTELFYIRPPARGNFNRRRLAAHLEGADSLIR